MADTETKSIESRGCAWIVVLLLSVALVAYLIVFVWPMLGPAIPAPDPTHVPEVRKVVQ